MEKEMGRTERVVVSGDERLLEEANGIISSLQRATREKTEADRKIEPFVGSETDRDRMLRLSKIKKQRQDGYYQKMDSGAKRLLELAEEATDPKVREKIAMSALSYSNDIAIHDRAHMVIAGTFSRDDRKESADLSGMMGDAHLADKPKEACLA